MVELGIVAGEGTLLGDQPIPIDVLYDTDRARRLAATFKAAVEHTAYYQRAMWTAADLTAEVIDEYAEAACICGLRERADERSAVHDALFGSDPPDTRPPATATSPVGGSPDADEGLPPIEAQFSEAGVVQRRRSVAHYLTLVNADPQVAVSAAAYREALWSPPASRSDGHAVVAGQWAALIAKDVWQEAICSVWSEFCRAGLARTRDVGRGLTWDETRAVGAGLVAGPPALDAGSPTAGLAAQLAAGTIVVPAGEGAELDVASASLEELRQLTERLDTASSGLVVLLELARRMAGRAGIGWDQAAHIASGWQPSISAVVAGLAAHFAAAPTVADTLWWLVSRFVVPVHESIAYSKLPEFTFRFRWEDGLLRFYDQGVGRFPLAAIRHVPLTTLTRDLSLWDEADNQDHPAVLTASGVAFVRKAFE